MSVNEIQKVDIAICTWNRAALLACTLDSFSRLLVEPSFRLNIIIVDNNSTDSTPEVIKSFQKSKFAKSNSVVAMRETRQGHTFSRNRAVEAADSDLMIWTDDDVEVQNDWVTRYVDAANQNPEVTFWGGEIIPRFEGQTPKWILENWDALKGCFAARTFDGDLELDLSRLPYGANFAIRTKAQKEFHFDESLGRRGDQVLGEDELDLFRRLLSAGKRGQWVPGAGLEHVIPKDRASEKYVFDYFVGQGRALVTKGNPWHEDHDRMTNEAKSEYQKYKLKRLVSGSQVWVSHMLRSALAQGQAEGLSWTVHDR